MLEKDAISWQEFKDTSRSPVWNTLRRAKKAVGDKLNRSVGDPLKQKAKEFITKEIGEPVGRESVKASLKWSVPIATGAGLLAGAGAGYGAYRLARRRDMKKEQEKTGGAMTLDDVRAAAFCDELEKIGYIGVSIPADMGMDKVMHKTKGGDIVVRRIPSEPNPKTHRMGGAAIGALMGGAAGATGAGFTGGQRVTSPNIFGKMVDSMEYPNQLKRSLIGGAGGALLGGAAGYGLGALSAKRQSKSRREELSRLLAE